jgi:two-component system response regulator PilR (NtrC family)
MATEAVHDNGRRSTILVADDERSMREMLAIVLQREGHRVLLAEGGRAAVELLKREPVDLLVSDIRMPDMSGVDVLRAAKQTDPEVIGIMITAFASTESAVEALRLGAHDYLSKPFDVSELRAKVREALEHRRLREENSALKKALIGAGDFANILGDSPAIREVKDRIQRVAPTNSTVLVTGESGTGKELVARAIHANSTRRSRPFVAVNCGALPETLLESELFGHLRGSFTGADSNKKGLIEVADHGTILLDEIGEMPPVMQVKLLRVLQERKFRRVGATRESDADIRVIAATNQDLAAMVTESTFREDLFYRINVIGIHIPPLRERREDVLPLAERAVEKFSAQIGKPLRGLTAGATRTLERYSWPGNVRELENVIERAVAFEEGDVVRAESLDLGPVPLDNARRWKPSHARGQDVPTDDALPSAGFDLGEHVEQIERQYIAQALEKTGGRKTKAAELLGMSFRSFRYYMKKYDLG